VRHIIAASVVLVPSLAVADSVQTSTRIVVEGVNAYSCGPLPNSYADVNGFMSGMTQSGSIYTFGNQWGDSNVWAADFPESTDSGGFDQENTAISYFAGHGVDPTGDTTTSCASASTCTSPPGGASLPAVCRRMPGDSTGLCAYTALSRQLVTDQNNNNCSFFNYSTNARWGESSYAGSWGGAGSDGGANLHVLHISHAQRTGLYHEVWGAMSGTHLLATTMSHSGDVANISDRGANFAARYRANSSSGVPQSWADAMNSNADRNSWCTNAAGSVVYGGGFGFNGCGAQVTNALGNTFIEAVAHLYETWTGLQNNANDARGNAWTYVWYQCNWDCNTWTFTI
jgi:hypothetical protein